MRLTSSVVYAHVVRDLYIHTHTHIHTHTCKCIMTRKGPADDSAREPFVVCVIYVLENVFLTRSTPVATPANPPDHHIMILTPLSFLGLLKKHIYVCINRCDGAYKIHRERKTAVVTKVWRFRRYGITTARYGFVEKTIFLSTEITVLE